MLPKALSLFLYRKYNQSFSQAGEDMILGGYMTQKNNGFFVDVGAYHPFMLSNTYRLYQRGWTGINIDAAPGSMDAFRKWRPRDINIEAAISDTPQQLTYYYLGPGNTMNTFSKEFVSGLGAGSQIKKEIPITTQRLDSILEQHARDREINVMSIDVEGLELQVLRSNNWDKYRPHLILLESFERMNDQGGYDIAIRDFFRPLGYRLVSKTINGAFFLRDDLELNPFNHVVY